MRALHLIKFALAPSLMVAAPLTALAAPGTAETAAPAAQPAPESLAVAHTIVNAAFPPERRQAMMDKMMSTVLNQMKNGMQLDSITDPGLHKILEDYLDGIPAMLKPATADFLPKQMEAMAQAYARMFPLAELKDIAAFSQTSSGRDYFQRSMDVMSDPAIAAVNTAYFRQVSQIARQNEGALKQKIAAYVKAHPDAVPGAQKSKS